MPDKAVINHVSDTARWVAMYRAMESARPDAIFNDPFARRLAGERGAAIAKAMDRRQNASWPMVVRTAVMDEIILHEVANGVTQVVNLAAGLDARPWRLPLPATLNWVDVDHAVMLDEKESALAAARTACIYEGTRLDLADTGARRVLFARLSAGARRTLVISEGLLIYLAPEDVAALSADLAASNGFERWLIDLASPRLAKMMQRSWGKAVEQGNAPFRFAPAEGTAFFERVGWKEREWRSTWDEALRLNRTMRMARLWQFIGRLMPAKKRAEFARFSGIVLMERATA